MTLTHHYDAKTGILWVAAKGVLTPEDIGKLVGYLADTTDHPQDVDTVWDMDELDFSRLKRGDIEAHLTRRRAYPERLGARFVLVAASDLGFGMCRMYQALSQARGEIPDEQIHVSRTREEAQEWLIRTRLVCEKHGYL